jgi:hypothetical protein
MKTPIKFLTLVTITAINTLPCFAADPLIVESRKADGTLNTSVWTETGGKWTASKNKSRISRTTTLIATNVSACATNVPVPGFKVSPPGLEAGATYQVEVTFSTSSTHVASPDLVVAVAADGVSASTIPTNTPALQGAGADSWNVLGTITPATNSPTLTFTYVSGTLSKQSRWYADAVRFTPVAPPKTAGE